MIKSVRWSTITVYEFGVGIGGSAVPRHGGPAVGLAKKPQCVWSTSVDAVKGPLRANGTGASESISCCGKRARGMADKAGESDGRKEASKKIKTTPKCRRRRRVRWLKPLERVSMLEKAGFSEKLIYCMLMESSDIAMSRRLSLRIAITCASPVV
ncbi:hypothetical protein BBJ28_00024482 [Nothophytophthora sp. Chile5]|nr:hypothetical protein BBJ28_00024482 [Nothophytophthora sp. Chile5]